MSEFLPDKVGNTDTDFLKKEVSLPGKLNQSDRAMWERFNASVTDLTPEFKAWLVNFIFVDVAQQLKDEFLAAVPAAPAASITLITDTLLAAPAASFDFTSIPATYKHLKVVVQLRSTLALVADQIFMRFNNDTSASYSWQRLYATAATVNAAETAADTRAFCGWFPAASATANYASSGEIQVSNYTSTTFYKAWNSHHGHGGAAGQMYANVWGGGWSSLVAVNRLTLTPGSGGNWATGSRATLYGLS